MPMTAILPIFQPSCQPHMLIVIQLFKSSIVEKSNLLNFVRQLNWYLCRGFGNGEWL